MMILLSLLASVALADPAEDLTVASDADLPLPARMEAFNRLVAEGATDIGLVVATANDDGADARKRWVSARVLGQVGGDRARSTLEGLLSDAMPAMRAAAAQSLGDLGDRSVVPKVMTLLGDPAVMVRAAAAESLGKLRDPDSVQALSDALASKDNFYRGSSIWVRRHYVVALGQIGSESAVPALLRCLDDGDEAVQAEAVRAFETVAGFSYSDGREPGEEREAWRRWAQQRLR